MYQTVWKHLFLSAAVTVCFLLLLEGGLHLLDFNYSPPLFEDSPLLGYELRPGAHGWQSDEGVSYISINSDGFRDREHSLVRPRNTVRIAFLGDSMIEGRAVPFEKSFTSLVEKRLNCSATANSLHVEALNFGVAGYNLVQILRTLQSRVWKYDPQIVIVALYPGSFVSANSRALHVRQFGERARFPIYVYQSSRLVPDSETTSLMRAHTPLMAVKSGIVDLGNQTRLGNIFIKAAISAMRRYRGSAAPTSPPQEDDTSVYLPPSDSDMANAWTVTEGLLTMIRDEVRKHGSELWVITLDVPEQVTPDVSARKKLQDRLNVKSLYYADERINNFADRNGISHFMLAPVMAAYAASTKVYLHGFANTAMGTGHWNEAGNTVAAQFVADVLSTKSNALRSRLPNSAEQAYRR